MALALGISPHGDLYIDDVRVTVGEVHDPWQFEVIVHKSTGPETYVVSNEGWTEVMPEVSMTAGYQSTERILRLAIDAPRRIPIVRGKLYREAAG